MFLADRILNFCHVCFIKSNTKKEKGYLLKIVLQIYLYLIVGQFVVLPVCDHPIILTIVSKFDPGI